MFWVCFDNGDPILGYVSGSIRHSFLHTRSSRVQIAVSCYDSTRTRGRIISRLRNKDSNN